MILRLVCLQLCDGALATITGVSGGTFAFNPEPGDGAIIDPDTGTVTGGITGTTYSVEYTTAGACPSVGTETVMPLSAEDASFVTLTPKCDGIEVDIIGDVGGTFAFNPQPNDGAMIDSNTGTVTGANQGTQYTIEYTTSGPCPESETESFETMDCIIPQVITPNNDNYNDSFDLSGFDVSSLEIFNRNGVKVYSKANYTNEWYGQTDSGSNKLPVGTYYYVMKYQDGKVKTSWIYLNY